MFTYNPNIYTGDLDGRCVKAAINHAMEEFPKESCGSIINGHYIRFENKAEDPFKEFVIDDDDWYLAYMNGEVECLVHSHNDFGSASMLDQKQQHELQIPSLIINLRNNSLMDCIVFGEKEHAPLVGRPFFWGAFDCGTLVMDYVWDTFGYKIKTPPHEWGFWMEEDCFMNYINQDLAFYEVPIKDIKKHDILLYNIDGAKYINHVAVVTSDRGEVLHHIIRNVSGIYPINYNRKYLRKVMRYKND